MRTEGDEPSRRLALLAAKDRLYHARKAILAQTPEDALEILENKFMRFEKSLLSPHMDAPDERPHHWPSKASKKPVA